MARDDTADRGVFGYHEDPSESRGQPAQTLARESADGEARLLIVLANRFLDARDLGLDLEYGNRRQALRPARMSIEPRSPHSE